MTGMGDTMGMKDVMEEIMGMEYMTVIAETKTRKKKKKKIKENKREFGTEIREPKQETGQLVHTVEAIPPDQTRNGESTLDRDT